MTFLTCIVIALVFMIITSSWFETFANNSGIDIIRRINEAVKQLKNAILGTYSSGDRMILLKRVVLLEDYIL